MYDIIHRSQMRALILFSLSLLLAVQSSAQSKILFEERASLEAVRLSAVSSKSEFKNPLKRLKKDADKALALPLLSVLDKTQTPPSGDKHDYMSLARYYWPDPLKPDGLPYISRDGEVNPEISGITDRDNFEKMYNAAHTLGLAYYFTSDEQYARKAVLLIRTWFLDPATRMNPNLNFGQGIKGKDAGRPSGLIETREIGLIPDAVALLAGSKEWTDEDQKGLVKWFDAYLRWLKESPIGSSEAASTNNHGVWYDVQAAAVALFVGKDDLARTILEEAKSKRIDKQIEPDGAQPRELARTLSKYYVRFNLEGLFRLASLGRRAGVDLWGYQSGDGRSIIKAVEWVVPYVEGKKEWTQQQIKEFKWSEFYPIFFQAGVVYGDASFSQCAARLAPEGSVSDRIHLVVGNK